MKNLCGNCNVCCVVTRIDKSEFRWRDTNKEAGEVCDKLINGRCVKYKDRPKACKNFECLWLQLAKSSKKELALSKWRPDNLGILVKTITGKNNEFLFHVEEIEEGKIDFDNNEFLSFIDMLFELAQNQKTKTSIILFYLGQKGYELKQNKKYKNGG